MATTSRSRRTAIVLDLAPVAEGSDAGEALRNARPRPPRRAARLSPLLDGRASFDAGHRQRRDGGGLAYVGAGTSSRIRIGAGGIMLPNHAPLVIAEQFGTLESLFPAASTSASAARRAPTRPPPRCAATSLRREPVPARRGRADGLFRSGEPAAGARGPGRRADVPVWILGSSLFGAQLAAMLGLPYAFASHFAPAQMTEAIHVYRAGSALGAARPSPM
jgi:hypothetical protein